MLSGAVTSIPSESDCRGDPLVFKGSQKIAIEIAKVSNVFILLLVFYVTQVVGLRYKRELIFVNENVYIHRKNR